LAFFRLERQRRKVIKTVGSFSRRLFLARRTRRGTEGKRVSVDCNLAGIHEIDLLIPLILKTSVPSVSSVRCLPP
jgi:hypothetical protein